MPVKSLKAGDVVAGDSIYSNGRWVRVLMTRKLNAAQVEIETVSFHTVKHVLESVAVLREEKPIDPRGNRDDAA